MKNRILILVMLLVALGLTSCTKQQAPVPQDPAASPSVTLPVVADHMALSEQEMLMPCSECHREATPDIYDEWFNSSHGVAQVKCYQCHGTYEDMERVPDMVRCSFCHAGMIENHGEGMACWQCHPAHRFTGHR